MSRLRKKKRIIVDEDEEWAAAGDDSDSNEEDHLNEQEEHLPERGVLPETKAILINRIDRHNGLSPINRSTRLLDTTICDSKKAWLGAPKSELRRRVRVLVSHWKRNQPLYQQARKEAAKLTLTAEDLADEA